MTMNSEPSRAGATSERSTTAEKSKNLSRIRPVEQSISKRANPLTWVPPLISLALVCASIFLVIFSLTNITNQALFEQSKDFLLYLSPLAGIVTGYYFAIAAKDKQLQLNERRAIESALPGSVIGRDIVSEREGEEIQGKSVIGLDKASLETAASIKTLHIRILEEPLTPQNVALTLEALTELTTKFWLIAKRRLPDLIEYTQTHD